MYKIQSRVDALYVEPPILIPCSGAKDGAVFHHDVRAKEHLIGRSMHHKLEVCGLKWSRDGSYLAAGSNDNSATVWTFERFEQPFHELQHFAAVKGLAWCPWRSSILATGAGSADCHLRLWNIRSGTCEQQVETGSQVCSVVIVTIKSLIFIMSLNAHTYNAHLLYPALGQLHHLLQSQQGNCHWPWSTKLPALLMVC